MTKAAAEKLWFFDRTELRDGDVILELSDTLSGWAISKIDKSPFSHALIWAGGNDFVEAVPGGVRNLGLQRVVVSNPARWLLLRHPDHAVGKRAAEAARRQVGKHYDTLGAARAKWTPRINAHPSSRFCSQLVADVYLQGGGGAIIAGKPPEAITPAELYSSTHYFSQSAPKLIECSEDISQLAQSLKKRSKAYKGSILQNEVKVGRLAFNHVKGMLGNLEAVKHPDIANPPGNLHELIDLLAVTPIMLGKPVADKLVINLKKNRYFNLADAPIAGVREQLIQTAVQVRIDPDPERSKQLLAYVRQEADDWNDAARRSQKNARATERYFQLTSLPLWDELQKMYWRNYLSLKALSVLARDL